MTDLLPAAALLVIGLPVTTRLTSPRRAARRAVRRLRRAGLEVGYILGHHHPEPPAAIEIIDGRICAGSLGARTVSAAPLRVPGHRPQRWPGPAPARSPSTGRARHAVGTPPPPLPAGVPTAPIRRAA